jgi:phosphoglycolate phosphatase-like HAD superfamily hydrolase
MIGDMLIDVEAGKEAGCKKSILIERDHSYMNPATATPDHIAEDTLHAIHLIFPEALRWKSSSR